MSAVKVFTCEQGTPEWLQARTGIVTASELKKVMSKGKGAKESETRHSYMCRLASEIILGKPHPSFENEHTERGHEWEKTVGSWYTFHTDNIVVPCGFIRNDDLRFGCSPDGLVAEDGGIEVKTKLPERHIKVLDRNEVPDEHVDQCQGFLLTTGRNWIDFMSYWPDLPPALIRVTRDEPYLTQIKTALAQFNTDLDRMVAKIRAMHAVAA